VLVLFVSVKDFLTWLVQTPGGESAADEAFYQGFGESLAREFNGAQVTLEHRFYGKSMPFGGNRTQAFIPDELHLGKLTIEQALADLAHFVPFLKTKFGANVFIFVFGGSYSGKLSAYFRYKYPHVCDAALAGSAPVFLDGIDLGISEFAYFAKTTKSAERAYSGCGNCVKTRTYEIFTASQDDAAKKAKVCDEESFSRQEFLQMVRIAFANNAMANYPPGNSTKMFRDCATLCEGGSWLKFFDREKEGCIDTNKFVAGAQGRAHASVKCGDLSGCGTGWAAEAWDFQSSTQVVQPIGTNGATDMFPPLNFSLAWIREHSKIRFRGAQVLPKFLAKEYGLRANDRALEHYTNVFWTNGDLDPWSIGGVQNPKFGLTLPNGAHHSELNDPSPFDSPDIINARSEISKFIKTLLHSHQNPKTEATHQPPKVK